MSNIDYVVKCTKEAAEKGKARGDYILAMPIDHAAELAEALEKAQTTIIELQQKSEINPRTHEIIELKDRITELESRTVTVKLPAEKFCPAEYAGSQLWSETEVWNKAITACADALRAAGILVIEGDSHDGN